MFGHRMDRMTDLYTTIVEDTKEFLGTDNEVIILTGSGTEFMESSLLNLVDENVLCTTCGSFSERQTNVAERLGKTVDTLEYEWGVRRSNPRMSARPSRRARQRDDAVTCVMNESSTGVRNPIEEIGDVVADYPDTYFVVDAVSRARWRPRRHRRARHRRHLHVGPEGLRHAARPLPSASSATTPTSANSSPSRRRGTAASSARWTTTTGRARPTRRQPFLSCSHIGSR